VSLKREKRKSKYKYHLKEARQNALLFNKQQESHLKEFQDPEKNSQQRMCGREGAGEEQPLQRIDQRSNCKADGAYESKKRV
jgi:hypothetical protein